LKLAFERSKQWLRRFRIGPFVEVLEGSLGAAASGESSGEGQDGGRGWIGPAYGDLEGFELEVAGEGRRR
jgi:hypothetical protein